MRIIVTIAAALLIAGPAFAQGSSQSPPAPNSSTSGPQPSNSIPAGSSTVTPGAPQTGNVGTTSIGGTPGSVPQAAPAAPSGSTTTQPSGAFQQTVPQPTTGTPR